ncbi:MarR family winged helix-turn-helix transcriptional regulator [Actinocrispum sp. NPDC049592]|uniref:MarR family winged helix-turn-helix transcriptional regulator n=1 Tax=Actinocrispum sp. NPDC049592 TaxID=3154835 RepID=UPI0034441083
MLSDGGPALFRLVRFFARRWITQASEASEANVQHVLVLEAVNASREGEPTVNAVAHQLGLDHSGASRMVKQTVAAGYLTRAESEQDRRRTVIRITASGHDLLDAAHQWQRQKFSELTRTWPDHDRQQFAVYLHRLANETAGWCP